MFHDHKPIVNAVADSLHAKHLAMSIDELRIPMPLDRSGCALFKSFTDEYINSFRVNDSSVAPSRPLLTVSIHTVSRHWRYGDQSFAVLRGAVWLYTYTCPFSPDGTALSIINFCITSCRDDNFGNALFINM